MVESQSISEERWPAVHTPKAILRRYLNRLRTNRGRTFAAAIAELEEQKSIEHGYFAMFGRTQEDRAEYEMHIKGPSETIEHLLNIARERIVHELEKSILVALGSYSPYARDVTIPPKHWPFLTLNFDTAAASGERLSFRNVRISRFNEFSEEQRELVNDDIRLSASELRKFELGEDISSEVPDRSPETPDRSPPVYTRVADAWKALPEEVKAKIELRGGKKKVVKIIHSEMQEVPFPSVEREFRRHLKDLEKSEWQPGT